MSGTGCISGSLSGSDFDVSPGSGFGPCSRSDLAPEPELWPEPILDMYNCIVIYYYIVISVTIR